MIDDRKSLERVGGDWNFIVWNWAQGLSHSSTDLDHQPNIVFCCITNFLHYFKLTLKLYLKSRVRILLLYACEMFTYKSIHILKCECAHMYTYVYVFSSYKRNLEKWSLNGSLPFHNLSTFVSIIRFNFFTYCSYMDCSYI